MDPLLPHEPWVAMHACLHGFYPGAKIYEGFFNPFDLAPPILELEVPFAWNHLLAHLQAQGQDLHGRILGAKRRNFGSRNFLLWAEDIPQQGALTIFACDEVTGGRGSLEIEDKRLREALRHFTRARLYGLKSNFDPLWFSSAAGSGRLPTPPGNSALPPLSLEDINALLEELVEVLLDAIYFEVNTFGDEWNITLPGFCPRTRAQALGIGIGPAIRLAPQPGASPSPTSPMPEGLERRRGAGRLPQSTEGLAAHQASPVSQPAGTAPLSRRLRRLLRLGTGQQDVATGAAGEDFTPLPLAARLMALGPAGARQAVVRQSVPSRSSWFVQEVPGKATGERTSRSTSPVTSPYGRSPCTVSFQGDVDLSAAGRAPWKPTSYKQFFGLPKPFRRTFRRRKTSSPRSRSSEFWRPTSVDQLDRPRPGRCLADGTFALAPGLSCATTWTCRESVPNELEPNSPAAEEAEVTLRAESASTQAGASRWEPQWAPEPAPQRRLSSKSCARPPSTSTGLLAPRLG